jgi:hypothetical protein
MSKILKVSEGDYRVTVPAGNSIVLDTGALSGSVIITGDLDVQGLTTTIESINATVKDNIIVLNNGDPGLSGISPRTVNSVITRTSGIEIDRGRINTQVASASILFDEEVPHYNTTSTNYDNGTFALRTKYNTTVALSSLQLAGIEVTSISNNGIVDIQFNLHNSNTYLSLVNSTHGGLSYEDRLIAGNSNPIHATNNSLTTKKYVNTYVRAGNLKAGMADVDTIYSTLAGNIVSMVETTNASIINFKINTNQRATITTSGLSVDTINLFGNIIKNVGSGSPVVQSPLILQSDANLVEINAILTLNDQTPNNTIETTSIPNKTKIYSKDTEGPGRTGIYFTNNNTYGSNLYNNDELVSKNRAVLLSMLF